jgi:hypothetical protein
MSTIYKITHGTFFSSPLNPRIFLPAYPHRLPPNAKVEIISNKFHPLTFHLACSFLNMLQKCIKQPVKTAFFTTKRGKDFAYKCMTNIISNPTQSLETHAR